MPGRSPAVESGGSGPPRSTTVLPLDLDPAFIGRLERLALYARQRTRGSGAGQRRSIATGSSVEFADYRTYAPGDDLRRVDWNACARLERLFLRVFEAEENATLSMLLDCSTSMAAGKPAKTMLARRVAASLAYLALHNYDRVAVAGISNRIYPFLPARGGKNRAIEVWRFLEALPETGETDLGRLAAYEALARGPGLAIVFTDLLTDSNWRRGLQALKVACKLEVTVIQVLAAEELDPPLDGEWTLVDAENQTKVEISGNPIVLRRYRQRLDDYNAEVAGWCRAQGIGHVLLSSSAPLDEVVLRVLRRLGVLQ